MAEKKRGWKVGSQFYKFYPVDQWRNGDYVLSEAITRKTSVQLFGDENTSYLTVQNAMLGVSMWRQDPTLKIEDIVSRVWALLPTQVTEVGFEDDASPPDESGTATPDKT